MWRSLLARLPLPMLALAASYGVYQFQLIFVPWWAALISAAAFELTYVGLAVAQLDPRQRMRASVIAASAVGVSIVYNSLAGLFVRRADLLTQPPLWADVALAVLHGLPLAIVAYNVAVLLLHDGAAQLPASPVEDAPALVRPDAPYIVAPPTALLTDAAHACPQCGAGLRQQQYAAAKRYGHCAQCKEV